MVQWLRHHTPNAEGMGSILGGAIKSLMPHRKTKKKKKKKPNKQKPPNGQEWKHLISHDESAQCRHTEGRSPSLGDPGLVHLSSAVNMCLITSLGCREDGYKVQKKHESQYQALISNHHHASDTYKGVSD